jgi:hypothetical protein
MSSKRVGLSRRTSACMPAESSWNTPSVSPVLSIANVRRRRPCPEEPRVVHVEVDAAVVAHVPLGVGEHREVAQPEEVHLEQAERLGRTHLVLGEDLAALGAHQRHDLGERSRADDHRGRVDAVVTLEALEPRRDLEHLAVLGLARARPAAPRTCERLLERRLDALHGRRHHLREVVTDLERLSSTRAASRIPDFALIVPNVTICATWSAP